jgi:hypothetical protein
LDAVIKFLHPGIIRPFARNETLPSIFALAAIVETTRYEIVPDVVIESPGLAGYRNIATPEPPAPLFPPLQQPEPPPPPPLFAVPEVALLFPAIPAPPPPRPPPPALDELEIDPPPPPAK